MKLRELTRLASALDMLGLDNGADVNRDATIPKEWEMRCRVADDEILHLSADDVVTLAMGEETERERVVVRVPTADAVIAEAFDGELSEQFFRPWRGIHDARRAEQRLTK